MRHRLFILVGFILGGLLFQVPALGAPTSQEITRQQAQQAQATLRAIGKQLSRFYTQHAHYPSLVSSEADFKAIGMQKPPSKVWDYFFQCTSTVCDVFAEHKRKYYSPRDLESVTPMLKLTVHRNKVDPIIHIKARAIWFMQAKNTTVLMEQIYAVPKEICFLFGGQKDPKQGCVLK